VTLPRPQLGLVIRYSYLWLSEHREGREEGVKDRPCAVVLALVDADGETRVTVPAHYPQLAHGFIDRHRVAT
jgi:hypothetical protein